MKEYPMWEVIVECPAVLIDKDGMGATLRPDSEKDVENSCRAEIERAFTLIGIRKREFFAGKMLLLRRSNTCIRLADDLTVLNDERIGGVREIELWRRRLPQNVTDIAAHNGLVERKR